jgi:hypothetical protein
MIKKLPFFLIFIVVMLAILAPFFIKVKIECRSQFGDCPAEVNSGLGAISYKNLFEARQKTSVYLKKHFLVTDFSFQFKLPDTMLVNIIVKKPYFALKNATSEKLELVDQKGIALGVSGSSSLPTVVTAGPFVKVGAAVNSNDLFALNLVSGVYQMYQVGYGTIENDALAVDMPAGLRVIFPLEGDSEVLLGSLRLIYTKVTTDYPGLYSQIDMRYKNPVLR